MGCPGRGATAWGRSPSGSRPPASRRWSSTTVASATAVASRTSSTPRGSSTTGGRRSPSRARCRVDPDRVATFGSSMGGGNALAAAADDPRVAAAISQVPFLDIVPPGAPLLAARRRTRCWSRPREAGHLPAVGQPHEAALINAPGGEVGWRHVVAIGEDSRWRNRVSSRWLLGAPFPPARARRDAALPLAGLRRRGRPGRRPARRSPPPGGRRWASCAPTPGSTTSTSTTAPSTRRSSPTRSPSCAGTCWLADPPRPRGRAAARPAPGP